MGSNDQLANDTHKPRLLYVGYTPHLQSKSTVFFVDLLKQHFSVTEHYASGRFNKTMPTAEEINRYDRVVFFQLIPSLFRLRRIKRPCFYVPMYDNEAYNPWQWRRLRHLGVHVISFSTTLAHFLTELGLTPFTCTYYPSPLPFTPGDPRKVFLWERGDICFEHLKFVLNPDDVDELCIRRLPTAPTLSEADQSAYKISFIPTSHTLSREEYFNFFKECGIYIAPRKREGIGMSFLEAMAMGKCVIGHRNATMNEYIRHEDNGLLVDFTNTAPLSLQTLHTLQERAYSTIINGYKNWEEQSKEMVHYIICGNVLRTRRSMLKWWLLLPLQFAGDIRTVLSRTHPYFLRKQLKG